MVTYGMEKRYARSYASDNGCGESGMIPMTAQQLACRNLLMLRGRLTSAVA